MKLILGTLLLLLFTSYAPAASCPMGYTEKNGYCFPPSEGGKYDTRMSLLYSLWHCPFSSDTAAGRAHGVFDISQVLNGSQKWSALGKWYWREKPLDGYYCLTQRTDVLEKHAIQLREAGIDYVYIDASNHPSSDPSYADRPDAMILEPLAKMVEVWSAIPGAPRIVPFVPLTKISSPMVTKMLAVIGKYPKMYYIKDNKPFVLLTGNPGLPLDSGMKKTLDKNYSSRIMWVPASGSKNWSFNSWCKNNEDFKKSKGAKACEQHVTKNGGTVEHIAVVPASNYYLFSNPSTSIPRFGGKTFVRMFDTLFKNPTAQHASLGGWNEWIAIHGCQTAGNGLSVNAKDCPSKKNGTFVDTYNYDYSRDMEPNRVKSDFDYRLMKACVANFRRGEACNEKSGASVPSLKNWGTDLKSTVARSCSFPPAKATAVAKKGEVLGYVDKNIVRNGKVFLTGWACVVGHKGAIEVQVYVNGPAGKGKNVVKAKTNVSAEKAIQSACGTSGVSHRFEIDITPLAKTHRGRPLFVHGVNPKKNAHHSLHGTGVCSMPWL